MWSAAAIFHAAGNALPLATTRDLAAGGIAALIGVMVSFVVLLAPHRWRLIGVAAALHLVDIWVSAPVVGNHWLLVGFVDIAILGALVASRGEAESFQRRLFPIARGIVLVFYSFAAFSKLNTGFFDPVVSCAVEFLGDTSPSFGVPAEDLHSGGPLAWLAMLGGASIELSVPLLLLWKRTRAVGVLVAVMFHTVVSFHYERHFYDFATVLFPLFLLFLSEAYWRRALEQLRELPFGARTRTIVRVIGFGFAAVAVAIQVLVPHILLPIVLGQLLFFGFGIAVVATVLRFLRSKPPTSVHAPFAGIGLLGALLIGLVAFNGLTPWFELKTGYSFTMYSNLRIENGETNHLVIPWSLPLSDAHETVYEVVDSNDSGLLEYRDQGHGLVEQQLEIYLTAHPATEVTVARDGEMITLSAGDVDPVGTLREKFQLFRAVDLDGPPQCQVLWGPAR